MTIIWKFTAWDGERNFICDCGTVYADTADLAYGAALLCLGGPNVDKIKTIELDAVAKGVRLDPKSQAHFRYPVAHLLRKNES